jgi:hypothetical protein
MHKRCVLVRFGLKNSVQTAAQRFEIFLTQRRAFAARDSMKNLLALFFLHGDNLLGFSPPPMTSQIVRKPQNHKTF